LYLPDGLIIASVDSMAAEEVFILDLVCAAEYDAVSRAAANSKPAAVKIFFTHISVMLQKLSPAVLTKYLRAELLL
jgi:hypothetical protein